MASKADEQIDDGEKHLKGRREVLGKLALGGVYAAPVVLAAMKPTRAAAASAGGTAPASPPFIIE